MLLKKLYFFIFFTRLLGFRLQESSSQMPVNRLSLCIPLLRSSFQSVTLLVRSLLT